MTTHRIPGNVNAIVWDFAMPNIYNSLVNESVVYKTGLQPKFQSFPKSEGNEEKINMINEYKGKV